MQWRKRRFVIAILSTAIIFAMTLVLTGLANGFRAEAEKTVDSLGCDVFLVKDGASGPFVGATPFAPTDLRGSPPTPGVQQAAPLAYAGGTVTLGDATRNADLFGAPERGPGMPAVSEGRPPSTPDEVAVSSTLGRNDWRRHRNRFAQAAHRRHRGELHRAGQPAQRLPHHGGRPAVGVRRPTPCRVDRDTRNSRPGARRLPGHRPRRRGRRPAPAAEGGGELDHDRRDPALDRRGVDRRLGDLPLRARTTARLRGVQGDWCDDRLHRWPGWPCRRSSSRCRPRSSVSCSRPLLGPIFPMQVDRPGLRVTSPCP